jgi:hypothetical protein
MSCPGRGVGRPRSQTRQEMLMPRAQYAACKRRRQAWRDRGKGSDKSTIRDEDEDKDGNDAS